MVKGKLTQEIGKVEDPEVLTLENGKRALGMLFYHQLSEAEGLVAMAITEETNSKWLLQELRAGRIWVPLKGRVTVQG